MATKDAVQQATVGLPSGSTRYWKWSNLTSTDTVGSSVPVGFAGLCLTFLIQGTWGTGTLTIQGSFDDVNWFTVNKVTGTAATATSDTFLSLSDLPLFVRPSLSGANGTDNVNIHLLIR